MTGDRQRMILYLRVSTEEQVNSGAGLNAQFSQLERAADYHGWKVVDTISDEGASGKDLARPGLTEALDLIARGKADGLAVAKLDRLSRSVSDIGDLAEWFAAANARFVALDLSIDTSTPAGTLVLFVLAAVAQWEREVIGQRTRDGLASLRASGKPISRPAVSDQPELCARIAEMRKRGLTFQAIADTLNGDSIPTLRGGVLWRPSSVRTAAGYQRRSPRRKPAQLPAIPTRRAA